MSLQPTQAATRGTIKFVVATHRLHYYYLMEIKYIQLKCLCWLHKITICLDSAESAQREINFFFPDFCVEEWMEKDELLFRSRRLDFDHEKQIHTPQLKSWRPSSSCYNSISSTTQFKDKQCEDVLSWLLPEMMSHLYVSICLYIFLFGSHVCQCIFDLCLDVMHSRKINQMFMFLSLMPLQKHRQLKGTTTWHNKTQSRNTAFTPSSENLAKTLVILSHTELVLWVFVKTINL